MERFVQHIKCVLNKMDLVFSIEGAEKIVRMARQLLGRNYLVSFLSLSSGVHTKRQMKNTTRSVGLGYPGEFWLTGMEGLGLIEVVGLERKHMETVEPFL
jgi:hypothetical protein